MLLLSVRVNGNLPQSEVLKVEWVSRCRTVENIVTHHADDDSRWNLSCASPFIAHLQKSDTGCNDD